MKDVAGDLRFAARSLAKNPGFAPAAVLALGIGAAAPGARRAHGAGSGTRAAGAAAAGRELHARRARRREIGLRMALGARPGQLPRRVVAQGMGPVAAGLAAGSFAALGLTRFLGGLLYGVAPQDPLTLAGSVIILALVALAADGSLTDL